MFKRLLIVMLVASPALGDHWISEQEVAKWADKTNTVATEFHEECKGVSTPSNFPNFMYRVRIFRDQLRNFRRSLYRGYSYCVPSFRQLRRDFRNLRNEFETNYSQHPNFRVRLGWLRVQQNMLETAWAFSTGNEI